MNKAPINLQDTFLNQVRKENMPVTIYLVNGFQLKGLVRGFDNFTVVIEFEGKQQMVYKHAISTVMPLRPINLVAASQASAEER
ncbi:RNA-binding protein Hfq [Desulfitobacterium sp. LBE]|uniref:RNA-binding protein Hfq n=5 Tax=root TaxID=1 RepID=HFQ_DESHY|nr:MULTISPECIES: RNA chaperone Hfq [Desulfitobacterium]Q24X67.1 RecName: Full=RNA-binding protein Hfq [Desulfitobacterium hafniense Y51]HHY27952.1 RNA chaperone Hfq [Desulfitobacterium dehalogenans]EHL07312.1 RNA chaperone Hfq [Desulfitobacterium hafniense DP7]MEA5025717.1 RNA chaperone Hfq [Desulfitobacterium hafniense]TWH56421.1 RNA-binding protein Hfq [Desulfitobacterium sp. LBE]SHN84142.1 RNA-binding protein Hfq [Desulfitobacterium chlororespirans DSM 11544]